MSKTWQECWKRTETFVLHVRTVTGTSKWVMMWRRWYTTATVAQCCSASCPQLTTPPAASRPPPANSRSVSRSSFPWYLPGVLDTTSGSPGISCSLKSVSTWASTAHETISYNTLWLTRLTACRPQSRCTLHCTRTNSYLLLSPYALHCDYCPRITSWV